MNENKTIEKIKKLFALAANKSCQGNEAENAMRMANKLLQKHAIEKHQLHDDDEVFCNFKDYPIRQTYIKTVCSAICKLYNCRVIFDYDWEPAKTLIIGTTSNRTTAIIVIEQLIDQISRDAKGMGRGFKDSAAIGLQRVVLDIIKERKSETEEVVPGTGLMTIDIIKQQKIAVDGFVNDNFSDLKSIKRAKGNNAAGFKYGSGLNPGARVSGSGQKLLS